jgi:outer membrane protein assembly factor BamB
VVLVTWMVGGCGGDGDDGPPLVGATDDAPGDGVRHASVVIAFDAGTGAERWRVRVPMVFAHVIAATPTRVELAGDVVNRCRIGRVVVGLDPATGAFLDRRQEDVGLEPYRGLVGDPAVATADEDRAYGLFDDDLRAEDVRTGAVVWEVAVEAGDDAGVPLSLLAHGTSVYLSYLGQYEDCH